MLPKACGLLWKNAARVSAAHKKTVVCETDHGRATHERLKLALRQSQSQTLVLCLQLDLTRQPATWQALGGHKVKHLRLAAVRRWQQRQLGFVDHAVASGATAASAAFAQQAIHPRGLHRLQQGLAFLGRHIVCGALRGGDMNQQHFSPINRRTHQRP